MIPTPASTSIQALAPSLEQANAQGARLAKLPEVAEVRTLSNFIPPEQDEKLPLIKAAAKALDASLNPKDVQPPPTDAENVDALKEAAQRLTEAADDSHNAGQKAGVASATRLARRSTSLRRARPSSGKRRKKP